MKHNYSKNNLGWFWLDSVAGLNINKKYKIYSHFGDGCRMFDIASQKSEWLQVVDEALYAKLNALMRELFINSELKAIEDTGIGFITIQDKEYPEKLRNIPVPPIVLYYRGDLSLLNTKSVAIVGTRTISSYGYTVTDTFSKTLAQNGITIISGLADGIDTVAHKSCLSVCGKTIAVLAGGLKHIYPDINRDLAEQIAQSGLLISENKPYFESKKYDFPIRNRIIAGLADAVLITEAGETSGTRHTVEYAVDTHTSVYAVPGNITNYRSNYPNSLIKTSYACIALRPEDILKDLNITYIPRVKENSVQLNMTDKKIVDILQSEQEVHFDTLQRLTGYDVKELNTTLSSMEIMGIIRKIAGNKYCLIK